jgi:hypothetical protein
MEDFSTKRFDKQQKRKTPLTLREVEAGEKAHDSLGDIFVQTVAAAEKQVLSRGRAW